MIEHSIIFSGPEVNAVLEDRKSQQRVAFMPQPIWAPGLGGPPLWRWEHSQATDACADDPRTAQSYMSNCPFGEPGARLWVREKWIAESHPLAGARVRYDAGGEKDVTGCGGKYTHRLGWRPSTNMPRWASRIDLELTGVRIQQVQDISEDDARAEGARWSARWSDSFSGMAARAKYGDNIDRHQADFAERWDKSHAKRRCRLWSDNPWVWVLEFKRS